MYLYYDKTGKLKEIINDEALRQGNYNANTIYVYVEEKQDSINYIRVNYLLPSDLIVGPQDYNTRESKMIPFDEKRDLEYFKYNTTYNFIKIVMEADENANGPLDMGGLVHCELRAFNLINQQILKLGTLNFQVELDEVAQQKYIALLPQEYMSLSDYRYLELLIGSGIGYVELNTGSGTLTDDQMAMINKDYCLIKYAGSIYYKTYSVINGFAVFHKIPSLSSTSNYWTESLETIEVNLQDNSYIHSAGAVSFYDKSTIDGLLAGYIELHGDGGTLSQAQLLEVQKNNCVINLDGTLFYKAFENESIWQFYKIPESSTNLLTGVATFSGKALPVSKNSGSWHWEGSGFNVYDTRMYKHSIYIETSGTGRNYKVTLDLISPISTQLNTATKLLVGCSDSKTTFANGLFEDGNTNTDYVLFGFGCNYDRALFVFSGVNMTTEESAALMLYESDLDEDYIVAFTDTVSQWTA